MAHRGAGISYDALRRMALALPSVEESTSYGTPALKVKGRLMARLKEDGTTVALRSDWEHREHRLATEPEVFFVTDHYRAHPWVLMALREATAAQARSALQHAWEQSAAKPAARQRRTAKVTARGR